MAETSILKPTRTPSQPPLNVTSTRDPRSSDERDVALTTHGSASPSWLSPLAVGKALKSSETTQSVVAALLLPLTLPESLATRAMADMPLQAFVGPSSWLVSARAVPRWSETGRGHGRGGRQHHCGNDAPPRLLLAALVDEDG